MKLIVAFAGIFLTVALVSCVNRQTKERVPSSSSLGTGEVGSSNDQSKTSVPAQTLTKASCKKEYADGSMSHFSCELKIEKKSIESYSIFARLTRYSNGGRNSWENSKADTDTQIKVMDAKNCVLGKNDNNRDILISCRSKEKSSDGYDYGVLDTLINKKSTATIAADSEQDILIEPSTDIAYRMVFTQKNEFLKNLSRSQKEVIEYCFDKEALSRNFLQYWLRDDACSAE